MTCCVQGIDCLSSVLQCCHAVSLVLSRKGYGCVIMKVTLSHEGSVVLYNCDRSDSCGVVDPGSILRASCHCQHVSHSHRETES